jgi:pimeloyl-ACP methyl ester carboxylesterase
MIHHEWHGPQDAPVVVLLHGLGCSMRSFERLVPLLTGRCRVLVVDLPGFGGTPGNGDYSMPAHAAAVRPLLDGPATVVGHSMGGLVGMALAEHDPGVVAKLVPVDSPPTPESRLTTHTGTEKLLRMPVVGPLVWRLADDDRLRAGLATAFAPGHDVPDVFLDDLRKTTWKAFAGSTKAVDTYVGERSLSERLRASGTAAHVVFGEQDQRVELGSLDGYEGVAPVTRLPGAGHTPIWEDPEAVAAVVV